MTRNALLAITLALLLTACGGGKPAPDAAGPAASAARPALTVTVTSPERVELATTLPANGNLAAWQEASIGAETGGQRITEVRVYVGDRVKRGQVLAVFARENANADVAQARAALVEAEAALADAAANAERARALQPSGALSAAQINQYLTTEKTARARVEAVRASLQSQTLRLGQTQVVAPDDGIISARSATVGAVVAPGTELFRLIRQGRIEWRAEVTASELGRIGVGTPAVVTAASGAKLQGRVRTIGPTVDPQTRNALVFVDVRPVAGTRAPALPGMLARGEFLLGKAPALTVPQSAVVMREGFAYVMAVDAKNHVVQRKVRAGRVVEGRIEITEGLAPDARIVASGGSFLNDGDIVRVAGAEPPAVRAEPVEAGAGPSTGSGRTVSGSKPSTSSGRTVSGAGPSTGSGRTDGGAKGADAR